MFETIRTVGRNSLLRNVIQRLVGVKEYKSRFAKFNNVDYRPGWKFKLSFLFRERTGYFGIPQLTHPSLYTSAKEKAIAEAEDLVSEAISPNRSRKMVHIFDDLYDCVCRVCWAEIKGRDEGSSDEAREPPTSVSSLVERFNGEVPLYTALRSVVEGEDIVPTSDIEKNVGKLFLSEFEQRGIHLDEKTRAKVVELNENILRVGRYFEENVKEPRLVDKNVVSQELRLFVKPVGSDKFAVSGLEEGCPVAAVREAAYRLYLQPDDDQSQLLDTLLDSRQQLAVLCGFKTHSHRVLKGSIANTPENVHSFLSYLSSELRPRAAKDYSEMLQIKKTGWGPVKDLAPWDVPFFTGMAKYKKFNDKPGEYTVYLSLSSCMDGLNMIFDSLYGVTLEVADALFGEVNEPSIIKLNVRDAAMSRDPIGIIYCDLFEGSVNGMTWIQGGRRKADGSYQIPRVLIKMDLPPGWPPLLTPQMMDNLFHEMGHAMHYILVRSEYQHATATRIATDLVEVPSILMEYFASDPRVVTRFARHYRTGEPMPEKLAADLKAFRHIFRASEIQLQVFYAFLDHVYHSQYPRQKSTTEILREVQNEHYGVPYVENTAYQLRFFHLNGYGARYYSYLMSRAVAASFWHKAFKADPLNRSVGMKYREKVLAPGASLPPAQLVSDFLGSDHLSTQELAEALIRDIDHN